MAIACRSARALAIDSCHSVLGTESATKPAARLNIDPIPYQDGSSNGNCGVQITIPSDISNSSCIYSTTRAAQVRQ